jgi:peptide deformylase
MFDIILNQQTPETERPFTPIFWIRKNKHLIRRFLQYSEKQTNAVGLAANQLRQDGERVMARMFSAIINGKWDVYIDPIITEYLGEEKDTVEGCLSWPGKKILAKRHEAILVTYYTDKGEVIEDRFEGFEAQVFQHEIDHLNGIEEHVVNRDYLPVRTKNQPGRNAPCPCGSGRKFKKCCLKS